MKLKGKVYRTVVRPAMLYGAETWATTKRQESRIEVNEMRMTKAIPGKRKRGRPKTRWKDVCKRDMQTVGLRERDEGDRAYWKETINNHSGDPR